MKWNLKPVNLLYFVNKNTIEDISKLRYFCMNRRVAIIGGMQRKKNPIENFHIDSSHIYFVSKR